MQLYLFAIKKRCYRCRKIKPLTEFSRNKSRKDGRQSQCKECVKKYYEIYKEEGKVQRKQYRENNKDKISAYHKQWSEDNKDKRKARNEKYYQDNTQKIKAQTKKYREGHKDEKREWERQYYQTPEGKITHAKHHAKRRELGFNPLNESFEGSVGHHINDNDIVHILKVVHDKFIGYKTEKHRGLVLEYYGSLENMLINKPNPSFEMAS